MSQRNKNLQPDATARRHPWRTRALWSAAAIAVVSATVAACAALQQVVQPLQFSADTGRQAELRLLAPSLQRPLGGVGVRLWARVQNPNPLGVNLTHLAGTLYLSETQAGAVDLPLGLPMPAQRDTVFPVEISLSLSDIPNVATTLARAVGGSAVPYRLDGRFSVGAGALGSFDFGPQTLLRGNATVFR